MNGNSSWKPGSYVCDCSQIFGAYYILKVNSPEEDISVSFWLILLFQLHLLELIHHQLPEYSLTLLIGGE